MIPASGSPKNWTKQGMGTTSISQFQALFQEKTSTIEEAYEFMLAYAAQGKSREDQSVSPSIRTFLGNTLQAIEDLQGHFALVQQESELQQEVLEACAIFLEDARKTRALLRLAISTDNITSQMVDNLNASIHIRAMLTDIFVIDEFLDIQAQA